MFSKKMTIESFSNLIAEGTTVAGTVSFTGVICIKGIVNGDLITGVDTTSSSGINVTDTGAVSSETLHAAKIEIGGFVTSRQITAEEYIRIGKNARIVGATIRYRNIEIEHGAVLVDCKLVHLDHMEAHAQQSE